MGPRCPGPPRGPGRGSGSLVFDTLGTTLDDQLLALARAKEESQQRNVALARPQGLGPLLAALQTSVDADLTLQGPDWQRAQVTLAGNGHLWVGLPDRDQALTSTPFAVRLEGPLRGGAAALRWGAFPWPSWRSSPRCRTPFGAAWPSTVATGWGPNLGWRWPFPWWTGPSARRP